MSFSYDNVPDAVLDEAVKAEFGDPSFAMEQKSQWYNFVCPFCGDPARPNKKKAYVYRDRWLFRCYKCGTSMHFMKYLKENNETAYSHLLLYGFDGERSKDTSELVLPNKKSELPFADGELVSLMDHHPLAEQAVEFCKRRKIRQQVYDQWFACQEGEQFLRHDAIGGLVLNEQGKPIGNEFKNRIIIPFYKYGGSWNQFDARAIDPNNTLRYRNFEGVKRQAYNIDFLDVKKPFYILEGTIDSTFIRNSIAIGGISHFDEVIADNPAIVEHKDNCTVIWDNDQAGELARIKSVQKGYKWFNWSGIHAKDVNGAVLSGEMPLDTDGYVWSEFIENRCQSPDGASIIFALERGDMEKRERQKQREIRMQLVQKMAAKNKIEVLF